MRVYFASIFVFVVFFFANTRSAMTPGSKSKSRLNVENWRSLPDRITELPGVMNMPTFNMFSGYLDASDSKKLHYWLNECTNSNSNVLLVWYNGGPGCSSLDGFFVEHGPYKFNKVNGDLEENPFSWNKLAHTLYIESPAGVGFSYDSNPSHIYNDSITAQENLHALESFFIKFPTYRNKDIYLSGESYAGVYVPALASAIVQQNTWMARHLRGLLIGNGLMHFEYNQASLIYFAYYHGLFDRRSWTELHRACCPSASKRCMFNAIMESDCRVEILKVEELVWNNGINVYNLYSPCMTESQRELSKLNSFRSLFTETALEEPFLEDSILEMRKPMSERSLSLVPPCTDASVVTDYLNRADVQAALHVRETNWQICSDVIHGEYDRQVLDTGPYIQRILDTLEDVRIFLYFGDVDMACNFMGGEWFVNGLGYEVEKTRRLWRTPDENGNPQVVGFYKQFDRLIYATVLGAGHMVPMDKPRVAYTMVERYLNDEPL